MSDAPTMICVGAIAGAYGVRGQVRLKSFCADPGSIGDYGPLATEDGRAAYSVRVTGTAANSLTATLGGVASKEQAEALRGTRLYAPRERLPALPDDEFYHADLIGLAVHDTGGQFLGRVGAIHDHGAGDLLEVLAPDAREGVLLPFTLANVPTIDLGAGRIVVDPPEGLFGPGADE